MVKHSSPFILFFLFLVEIISAQIPVDSINLQVKDTLIKKDTFLRKDSSKGVMVSDSFSRQIVKDSTWIMTPGISFQSPQFSWEILKHHPYFDFKTIPKSPISPPVRKYASKDLLFYLLILLLILFALFKRAFPKYFNDLFRLFFRTTLKQRQIREQLIQTPLPSIFLNGFFVIIGGMYATFLLKHFKLITDDGFWILFLYCCIGLSVAYMIKFIGLKISGWLFNMPELAESYIFIVFIVNKMIGILLLPFVFLLAFSIGEAYTASITLSWCVVGGLLVYRFILTYMAVHNQVKVNPFHFFLYLCAFEIAPLLLVYKGLLLFFRITA